MAEFVQQSLEEMLPELRFMTQTSLFTEKETEEILRRRTQFEYRLVRRQKEKADFLQYIQYELNLIALWNLRLKKLGSSIGKMSKQHILAISMRVNGLFSRVCQRFPADIQLWLSHVQFCKHLGWDTKVSKVFFSTLKHHNDNEKIWIMAARWEIDSRLDFSNGRTILHRALKFHPRSKLIWIECFNLELSHTVEAIKRRSILAESIGDRDIPSERHQHHMKAAEIVFRNVLSTFPNEPLFWLSFLKLITYIESDNFMELRNLIITQVEKFSHDGRVVGNLIILKNSCNTEFQETNIYREVTTLHHFDLVLQTDPRDTIFVEYAQFCIQVAENFSENVDVYNKLFPRLIDIVDLIIARGVLVSECLLLSLIDFSINSKLPLKAEKLLDLALTSSTWFEFYHRRVVMLISEGRTDEIEVLLKKAEVSRFSDPQLTKLLGVILWAFTNNSEKPKAVKLLEMGITNFFHKRDIPLKECLFRLISEDLCGEELLKYYLRLIDVGECGFGFIVTVVEIMVGKATWEMLSVVMEKAVEKIGANDPRVWLLYIELDGRFNGHKMTSILNWRALKILNNVEGFVEGLTIST